MRVTRKCGELCYLCMWVGGWAQNGEGGRRGKLGDG